MRDIFTLFSSQQMMLVKDVSYHFIRKCHQRRPQTTGPLPVEGPHRKLKLAHRANDDFAVNAQRACRILSGLILWVYSRVCFPLTATLTTENSPPIKQLINEFY